MIPLITENRLASGVQVARTAGDLWAASDIVALMEMPVLAGFLESRGERLRQVAADVLQRAGQAGAFMQGQDSVGAGLTRLTSRENAEELARRMAAESAAERIEEVALAGAGLMSEGQGQS